MPKATLAWTASADMVWSGDLRDDFRPEVEAIVGAALNDEAWHGLSRVVMGYSMQLSHEHSAVSLSEQIRAVHQTVIACAKLIEALEVIQQPEMGTLVTTMVSDKWEEIRQREAEAERNHARMASDISALFGENDEGEIDDSVGWALVRGWLAAGRIETPSVGADLMVQLWEVQSALKLTEAELKSGKTFKNIRGEAFEQFVGRLDEWAVTNGLKIGASKQGVHGSYGRLTNLVKAIVHEVPMLLDDDGKPLAKQIRRHISSDQALAEAIIDARSTYQSYANRGS